MADNDGPDRDLLVERASRNALPDLQRYLARLVSEDYTQLSERRLYQSVMRIRRRLDVFQEDPQLLDPILNSVLTAVLDRYLQTLQSPDHEVEDSPATRYAADLSKIICAFCKVRGRKVISRFLSNEPRYLHVLFNALHRLDKSDARHWEEPFVVLLWLSHLILTPFDLATFSAVCSDPTHIDSLTLPSHLPEMAINAVKAALASMSSASSRQVVSASLLARLALRPDMQKLGLLDTLVPWAISQLKATKDAGDIHRAVSLMMFMNDIIHSASLQDIGQHAVHIYEAVGTIFAGEDGEYATLRLSAVAKRYAIKILRNVVVQALQGRLSPVSAAVTVADDLLETRGALEEVIDHLLRSLADRDTQVRMAASKALALVALKLDADMAQEVVDAVIGSMNEDVFETSGVKTLEAVNAVKWHGLTLTLSHMLFRRTPSPTQIPAILDALFLALAFEQKTPSGGSVGGNVRDAANYGLWSLARRYSTKELMQEGNTRPAWIVQDTARQLLCAACLDPIGNVRRGSSAALQELIGRHPDIIANGIALVQTVDYLAVGLRRRAMVDVGTHAAQLDPLYLQDLFTEVCGWRGLRATDQASRSAAAEAVGRLTLLEPTKLASRLQTLQGRITDASVSPEELEGVWLAQAAVFNELHHQMDGEPQIVAVCRSIANFIDSQWSDPRPDPLALISQVSEKRAGVVANGYLSLFQAMSSLVKTLSNTGDTPFTTKALPVHWNSVLPQTLAKLDNDSLIINDIFVDLSAVVSQAQLHELQASLKNAVPSNGRIERFPGITRALGNLFHEIKDNTSSREALLRSDGLQGIGAALESSASIEARSVGLRTLGSLIDDSKRSSLSEMGPEVLDHLFDWVADRTKPALDDYTINEKGDVGSLLRSQALRFVLVPICAQHRGFHGVYAECLTSALRISVEKLARPRLDAVTALLEIAKRSNKQSSPRIPFEPGISTLADVSTYEYFRAAASLLLSSGHALQGEYRSRMNSAIIEGLVSSAGSASSNVTIVARDALVDVLDQLPDFPNDDNDARGSSIYEVSNILIDVLSEKLTDDRIVIPLLELMAFLLEAGVVQRLSSPPDDKKQKFKFRTLLSFVQKAHFKSSAIPKLLAAISVYRGLAEIPELKSEVLKKLIGMLAHPFPTVRLAVADVLWAVTEYEDLLTKNWMSSVESNKATVTEMKIRLLAA